ncbi:AAA family ATPase [Pseudomonas oryzihabitans]|uniref:AAA family ATPase n=1 Tax=Pseudomonas oryzihabitans TaxID=47885 RepID=UPI001E5835D0|nr:AAA family ATPase [Pseudomonas oryzihabitans]
MHDQKKITLLPEDKEFNHKNTYTVVIGKNGVGKSRLLASIIKNRLGTPYSGINLDFPGLHRDVYFDALVLAVSTSPFDKFPSPRNKHSNLYVPYRYVGMRGEGMFSASSAISLISSASKGLLEKTIRGINNANFLEVFSALSFEPNVNFILKPNFERFDEEAVVQEKSDRHFFVYTSDGQRFVLDQRYKPLLERLDSEELDEISYAMSNVADYLFDKKAISLRIDFLSNEFYLNNQAASGRIIYSLKRLLDTNFIRIMDLRLTKEAYGELNLRTASSGEQCLMVMMLGIAGYIEDGSLILIDEPEISLHPRWQEEFMNLLSTAFSGYKDCHFIIATHSPQIVSRLNDENSYVYSLTKERLYEASDFNNKSADYQLAELFDAPGLMNEYVTRLCFNLIAKLKAHKGSHSEFSSDMNKLLELKEKIQDTDPTVGLIESVSELYNYYANN